MTADLWGALLRLAVALPLTILLIYVTFHWLARMRSGGWNVKRRLQVVEQLPLGGKSRISLVKVGNGYYLLGHGDDGVALLKEFAELPEASEWMPLASGNLPGPALLKQVQERVRNRARGRDKRD